MYCGQKKKNLKSFEQMNTETKKRGKYLKYLLFTYLYYDDGGRGSNGSRDGEIVAIFILINKVIKVVNQ